jgi:hypothetical protein
MYAWKKIRKEVYMRKRKKERKEERKNKALYLLIRNWVEIKIKTEKKHGLSKIQIQMIRSYKCLRHKSKQYYQSKLCDVSLIWW